MKIIVSPIPDDETRSIMAFLPVDILYYSILTKLPAKSLLRFKSVCKDWYNLINSSNFRNIQHTHTLESHNSCDFLVVSDACTISTSDDDTAGTIWTLSYTYLNAPSYTSGIHRKVEAFEANCDFVGSSNGLICLNFAGSGFLLCNPVTGEYSRLIKSPPSLASCRFSDASYGFGYDVVSRDYKIVSIELRDTEFRQDCTVHVYRIGSNSWKKDRIFMDSIHRIINPRTSVVLNNKFHWVISKYTPPTWPSILIFDLDSEEFGEMTYPTRNPTKDGLQLMVSRGRLCMLATHWLSEHWNVSMWVMKEYGVVESWTKSYEIVGKQICTKHFQIITQLPRRDREEVLLLRSEQNRNRKLVWYNLESKSITGKADDPATRRYHQGTTWECIASLAPIPGNGPNKRHTDIGILGDIKKEVALGYLAYRAM